MNPGWRVGKGRRIGWSHRSGRARGAVLLEVLLALALFVAAAAVATSALNSGLESLERQKLGLHALNLASSAMAELQLGIRPLAPQSVEPLPAPDQDWLLELVLAPMESGASAEAEIAPEAGPVVVEVVIRHATRPVVQRLAQVLKPGAAAVGTGEEDTAP